MDKLLSTDCLMGDCFTPKTSMSLTFAGGALVIKPTESGFEAIIGDGFTIDDATKAFVDGLNQYMKALKL